MSEHKHGEGNRAVPTLGCILVGLPARNRHGRHGSLSEFERWTGSAATGNDAVQKRVQSVGDVNIGGRDADVSAQIFLVSVDVETGVEALPPARAAQ